MNEKKERARNLIMEAIKLLVDNTDDNKLEVIDINYSGSTYSFEGEILSDQARNTVAVNAQIRYSGNTGL